MADVIKSVRQYLLGKTAVTDLVGQRIYSKRLPQNATLPAVTMRINNEGLEHALDGLVGLVATRVQFECFGASAETSRAVADAIVWCGIDRLQGVSTSVNIRSVTVEDGRREFEDEDTSGGDSQRHVTSFDLKVVFART